MMKKQKWFICVLMLIAVVSGCSTYYSGDRYRRDAAVRKDVPSDRSMTSLPLFFGAGTGSTAAESERNARYDVLMNAAQALLKDDAQRYEEELKHVIFRLQHTSPYLVSGSWTSVLQEIVDDAVRTVGGARVNLSGLAGLLKQSGISGGIIESPHAQLQLPDQQPDGLMQGE